MRNTLLVTTFVICWRSGFVGSLLAWDDASPVGLLAWRYLLTTALLVSVVTALRFTSRRYSTLPHASLVNGREVLIQVILGVLSHVIFLGAVFSASAVGVDAGLTSLICALQPVLVAVIGSEVWRDRIGRTMIASLCVGLTAVALSAGSIEMSGSPTLLLLPVASLLALSTATVMERACTPRMGLLPALTVQTATAAACFTLVAVVTGQLDVSATPSTVGALTWLVLLSGIGGYASFTACLRTLGGTVTSSLLFLTPPVTTLWSWLMFGQMPSTGQIISLALGIIAVGLFNAPSRENLKNEYPVCLMARTAG